MKRFLSTLIAIFVSFQLLGITSGAEVLTGGSDDGAVSTEVIEVAEEGAVFISNVHADTSADGMINFAYEIMNETDHVVSAKAIVAFYNENGAIIGYNTQSIRLSAHTSKAFLLSEEVYAYTAKIFLVNNNYIPLCTPEEFVIGNWSEDSGVRMEWNGTGFFYHPEDGVLLTLDTQRNTLTFAAADFYFDNELVLIMLMDRETNNIYFIDQVTAHEGTLSLGEKLPAGEHLLWLFGSDGSSANASFEYYGGGSEGGEGEIDYEREVLDRINTASSYQEIRVLLEEYKDIIWVNDEYYSLDIKGQLYVCQRICGRYFDNIEDIRAAIDNAIEEYNESQIVSPPSSGGSGGGGGSSIDGDNVVSVATVKGNAGDTVCVDVLLNNNTGITSMGIEVDYDDSVMTLTDVQTTDYFGATVTPAIDLSVKPYHIMFDSTDNFTYNGVLATLTFEIATDAPTGEYPITVDYYKGPENNYVDGEDINFDENFAPVPMIYAPGALKIYMPGDLNDDKKVTNKDVTYMLRYLADWDIPDIVTVALDVNGDSSIDENDATHLLRYIAKWSGIVLY